jgi:hypothetical protein
MAELGSMHSRRGVPTSVWTTQEAESSHPCDSMPSIPRKQPLSDFLTGKGFWVIYPRYRGAWESGGEFFPLNSPPSN